MKSSEVDECLKKGLIEAACWIALAAEKESAYEAEEGDPRPLEKIQRIGFIALFRLGDTALMSALLRYAFNLRD